MFSIKSLLALTLMKIASNNKIAYVPLALSNFNEKPLYHIAYNEITTIASNPTNPISLIISKKILCG